MFQPWLADRAVLRVHPEPGESAHDFLQGLVTQDMHGQLPVWTALLSPQGKCLFDFLAHPAAEDVLIDCEADAAEELARRLSLYRLRRKISIAVDDGLGVYWRAELTPPDLALGYNDDPRLPALGQRWVAARSAADQNVSGTWRTHRLALGVPEGRAELGDILWLECNAAELHGVSFSKGCYVGQENTARMNWRQKVNRRVVVVPASEADGARQRVSYHELGWSVEHRRLEDIPDVAWHDWMGEKG